MQTHKSPSLPIEHLLPAAREPAPIEGWDAPLDEDCFGSAQGCWSFAPRWSRSRALLRDIQLLTQNSPAAKMRVEDAISAAISESMFISEAFPKKILRFPGFVLAQLLWKGKMKNKQNSFSESSGASHKAVQCFLRSSGLTEAVASGGDQAAFTEWLQLNLFPFSPLTLCQCFGPNLLEGRGDQTPWISLNLTSKH